MKAFSSALVIFGCFVAVLILSVFFLSEDKNEVQNNSAQQIIYNAIGDLGGFSNGQVEMANTINLLSDNIDNSDIETIVNCYTNSNVTTFRDHLRAVNFSMGQFCKVQQNLEVTSTSNQHNNDRCIEPKSIILSTDELGKLDRKYTGDLATDLAQCEHK